MVNAIYRRPARRLRRERRDARRPRRDLPLNASALLACDATLLRPVLAVLTILPSTFFAVFFTPRAAETTMFVAPFTVRAGTLKTRLSPALPTFPTAPVAWRKGTTTVEKTPRDLRVTLLRRPPRRRRVLLLLRLAISKY